MLIFIPGHAGLLPFLIQAFLLCLVVTALPPGDRRNRSPGDVPEQAGRNPQSHEHPAATTAGWTGQYPPFDLTEYDPGVHCPHESSPNGGGATWGLVPTIDAAAELDPTPGQEYPVAVPNYDPLTNTANYMAVPPTGESQGGSSENPQNPQEYFGYQNRNPFAPSYLSSGFLSLPSIFKFLSFNSILVS
ncbi:hypothetical protein CAUPRSCDRAFT_13074 [Caulochytrium protostelioides]|uniref:Uncharacterized protein n=1 Tax=Caulochytrium protostelioides TaxID=1555241 RepID=A0A4P9WRE4_9FUNG|nr:hypothetical protein CAUPRSCDRAFT_13074 [Caulochytrium protostelioides]